jgi:cytochrome c oxidase assembly protein Cox11
LDAKITAVDTHARSTKSTIIATVIGAAIGIVGISFAAVAIYVSAMGTTASAYQSGMAAAEARQK